MFSTSGISKADLLHSHNNGFSAVFPKQGGAFTNLSQVHDDREVVWVFSDKELDGIDLTGSMEDFDNFIADAKENGYDVCECFMYVPFSNGDRTVMQESKTLLLKEDLPVF